MGILSQRWSARSRVVAFVLMVSVMVGGTWLPRSAWAGSGPLSLGLILGGPSGVSAGYQLNGRHELDLALAWTKSEPLYLHADYLWQPFRNLRVETVSLDFFWGIGGRLINRDESVNKRGSVFGARFPFGLRHQWEDPSLMVFAEIALLLDLAPETDVGATVALGLRYVF